MLKGCGRKIGKFDCCTVVCGDCLELMKSLPDGCVDAVITDFPYGVGVEYASFEDTESNVKRLVNEAMPAILRCSRRAVVTCATRQIGWYPDATWILCWLNRAGSYCNPWGFTCWQPILCYGPDPFLATSQGSRPDVIEHSETSEKNGHPVPKPIRFWEKLMARCTLEDETILDPFLGSGTTAVAAKKLGRHFLGFEISPEYCKIAEERIALVEMKPTLFEKMPEQLKLSE